MTRSAEHGDGAQVPGRRGEGEHSDQGPPGLTGAGGDLGIVSGRATRGLPAPRHALAMWALTFLFFLRVLGQALVAFAGVTFLPPMEAWYSGLVPYPVLLPAQVVILALMLEMNVDVSRGRGFFAAPRLLLGRPLRWFALVYFAAMILRLLLTTGGRIPTGFHFVLAAYLFILSHYQTRLARRAGRA